MRRIKCDARHYPAMIKGDEKNVTVRAWIACLTRILRWSDADARTWTETRWELLSEDVLFGHETISFYVIPVFQAASKQESRQTAEWVSQLTHALEGFRRSVDTGIDENELKTLEEQIRRLYLCASLEDL
jgi:hypothetical protein